MIEDKLRTYLRCTYISIQNIGTSQAKQHNAVTIVVWDLQYSSTEIESTPRHNGPLQLYVFNFAGKLTVSVSYPVHTTCAGG